MSAARATPGKVAPATLPGGVVTDSRLAFAWVGPVFLPLRPLRCVVAMQPRKAAAPETRRNVA
jgi:hypothetical protein